jgi:hypothetical protein
MPLQYVLADLLADHPDAIGVLFLDDSGETVDFASIDDSPYEIQLLGAYLGIYLRRLGDIVEGAELGTVRKLYIEFRDRHFHVAILPDGYCLALVQRQPALVASARVRLGHAATAIAREVFNSEMK